MKAKIMLKKMMIAGLMTATVMGGIAPAYAQRGDQGGWRGRGESVRPAAGDGQRGGQREGGGQRGGEVRQQAQQQRWGQNRGERPAAQPDRPRPDPRIEQRWSGVRQGARDAERETRRSDAARAEQRREDRPQWRSNGRDGRADWRNQRNEAGGDRRYGYDRREGRWNDNDRNRRVERRFDDRTRWSSQRRWDNGWRQDRRYDWRNYRSRYGDRYRIGRYYAPRGWDYGYRRYSIGIFLNSLLFANNYWIDDPWEYRLPPAYGTLRWVRYYDDALLVDLRDGYVVDVIHDFFW